MANSFPMPINISLAAGVAKKLSTDITGFAEEYQLQASSFNGAVVVIGRLDDNGDIPAGPYNDTNSYTMYTINNGGDVPLRKSWLGRANGEAVKLSDLWGFCTANARLFANPMKRV